MHTMKPRMSEHGPTLHCTGVDLKFYLQFWVSQQKGIISVCPEDIDKDGEKSQGQD